ncbi:unnamed protein product [Heterobilharzia americana]|nr:unnamed protein product [Heterobilharzia americana]
MKKSSFNLRAQVEQLLCKVAVEYFSQGYLNRASHLVTNIPEIFVDGSYFGQANVLALWLMKNASYLKPVLTWPKAFLNLMEDFDVFGHTLECSKKNPSSFTLKEKSILQSNNVSQAANAILTSEDSTYNLDSSRRTVRNETFCQLRYLLNQLTIAKCYEWMCLISLLCLDKNALLRSLSIAVYNTTLSDTSHLQRESVHPHTTVVNNPHQANLGVILDPMSSTKSSFNETSGLNVGLRPHHTLCFFDDNLSRLITGLAAVKQWSREKYPLYHQFLISFEPVLNEFLSQLQLFLKEKNDISIGSPNFNVFVKRGIIPNTHVEQVTEINSPAASNASDTDSFQYSKLQREISNCSFAEPSKAVEKVSFHLNYPSTFDTMFHLEHNKVDQSLLLNSSSRSRRDYLDKFVSPTPVMLNSDNLNEKHWTSIDHFLPSGSSAALSITDSNEHLFNGTTEDSSFQSETSEKWTCSIT